ncbi:MAG: lasso peptide biosynthesis B2 protein [Salinibacterium sp.]|nr:lasso peptide biosynthesis B2 protein [Salinibacterium sp.]
MIRSPRRQLPQIPLAEWPELFACLGIATVIEIGLRFITLPRLAALVGAPLSIPDPGGAAAETTGVRADEPQQPSTLPESAQRQVQATMRILRHWPFGDTCLRQALISGQRMRRLGPRLHVGVAKVDGEVKAHAWLVVKGGVVDPRFAASSYHTLTSIPNRLAT